MNEQAGIYRISLYENKDLLFIYSRDTDNTIINILNSSTVLEIENSDCDTTDLGFSFTHRRSGNNTLKYRNSLSWKYIGLTDSNIQLIQQIKQSIYGWVAMIEFYKDEKKIIEQPFKFVNSSIDNNVSNHYNIELQNRVFGNRLKDYVPLSDEVVTADSNTVTADSNTVDASGGRI